MSRRRRKDADLAEGEFPEEWEAVSEEIRAVVDPDLDLSYENCITCDKEQPQYVRVNLVTENRESANSSFSREPYRFMFCPGCETDYTNRMTKEGSSVEIASEDGLYEL